jgi:flagellar biosynthetic protein FliR
MDLFNASPAEFHSFLLTLFRISVVVFLLPFFGGKSVPKTVKAALTLVLTLAVWPHLSFQDHVLPEHPLAIILMFVGEILLGLVLSLVVNFIFAAVQTGGQIAGFMMGFAMVNVVDPMTGTSEAVTAHFLYMTALLVFLALDGHLVLLSGVAQSFQLIPPGGLVLSDPLAQNIMQLSSQMFSLAVKIAAPVIASIFMVDVALALVGRAAPQMNVLLVGFPIKIATGFFFISMVFTLLSLYLRDFIGGMPQMYYNLLSLAG